MYIPTVIRNTLVRQRVTAACIKRFDHGGPTAGAVASSKGFGEKERAVENQWAKMHVSIISKNLSPHVDLTDA